MKNAKVVASFLYKGVLVKLIYYFGEYLFIYKVFKDRPINVTTSLKNLKVAIHRNIKNNASLINFHTKWDGHTLHISPKSNRTRVKYKLPI